MSTDPAAPDLRATKTELRSKLRARRSEKSPEQLAAAAELLAARVLVLPEMATARTVSAYLSYAAEPGTGPLLEALHERGIRVLLPVVRDDWSLDWAVSDGRVLTVHGVPAPGGEVLGADALDEVDVVLAPAQAVDEIGHRLGQGRGCYDRALSQLRRQVPVVALVHDDELLVGGAVPIEPHDRPVQVVVTPVRTVRIADS